MSLLRYARVVIFVWVINRADGLILFRRQSKGVKAKAAVGQFSVRVVEIFVDGTSEDHALVPDLALDRLPRGIKHEVDIRVIEHTPHHGGVALLGHALIAVLEIAIISRYQDWHASGNRGREVFRPQVPLFSSIALEDILVDKVSQETQVNIFYLSHLEDRHPGAITVGVDEFLAKTGSHRCWKDFVNGIKIEWHRNQFAIDRGQHTMEIRPPLGKA